MPKKGEYNYEKWVPIVDFIGLTAPDKRDWLINYFQQLEDNGYTPYNMSNNSVNSQSKTIIDSLFEIN